MNLITFEGRSNPDAFQVPRYCQNQESEKAVFDFENQKGDSYTNSWCVGL